MYQAHIAKIDLLKQIDGANTIQQAFVLNTPIIVGKEVKEGDIGIFFPSDGKIEDCFLKSNNLYRDKEQNKDKNKSGFFDYPSGRVRCQKFMKVNSDGFWIPLNSLKFILSDKEINNLQIGQTFDTLKKTLICQKYIGKKTASVRAANKTRNSKVWAAYSDMHKFHVDTDQFDYYGQNIQKGSIIAILAKIHGTSQISSYVKVKYPVKGLKKLLGFKEKEKWEYLVSSRRVIIDFADNRGGGYYGDDQFRHKIHEQIKPFLSKGQQIYYEIYGMIGDKPIMPPHEVKKLKDKELTKQYGDTINYIYDAPPNDCAFRIYRITTTTEDNLTIDWSWNQIKNWAAQRNLPVMPEIETVVYDGNLEKLQEKVNSLLDKPSVLNPRIIEEGVVLKIENSTNPFFLKKKGMNFKIMEDLIKETTFDIEDAS